jgi:hypothetical protein
VKWQRGSVCSHDLLLLPCIAEFGRQIIPRGYKSNNTAPSSAPLKISHKSSRRSQIFPLNCALGRLFFLAVIVFINILLGSVSQLNVFCQIDEVHIVPALLTYFTRNVNKHDPEMPPDIYNESLQLLKIMFAFRIMSVYFSTGELGS